MQWEYRQPVVIHFGNGKLAQLSDEIDALGGTRALLVTSKGFVKRHVVSAIVDDCGGYRGGLPRRQAQCSLSGVPGLRRPHQGEGLRHRGRAGRRLGHGHRQGSCVHLHRHADGSLAPRPRRRATGQGVAGHRHPYHRGHGIRGHPRVGALRPAGARQVLHAQRRAKAPFSAPGRRPRGERCRPHRAQRCATRLSLLRASSSDCKRAPSCPRRHLCRSVGLSKSARSGPSN